MNSEETRQLIEARIQDHLEPKLCEVIDESAQHIGHAGAVDGAGHFRVRVVSDRFEDLMLIDQHRLVHEAVGYPMDGRIHALTIKTIKASRWEG